MKNVLPAIVLAAGASTRLGRPKQLVIYKGETLLARAIRLAFEASAEPVLCILGANCEPIRAAMTGNAAVAVVNERWEDGISSSIHAGLNAVNQSVPDARGALLLACDQPFITADHLRRLLQVASEPGEPIIAASTYAGVRGIPAVFPRRVFSYLYALRGDKGARALLIDPPCELIEVRFEGGEIDIDVPDDLLDLH